MSLTAITQLVESEFNSVNQLILEQIESNIGLIEQLGHHIIDSGGKRLRPLLLLITANACGYQGDQHIPVAASIEYFHTATLLHDDVVDDSHLRRGKETAHDVYGSKASILVGDYMFTLSIRLMLDTDSHDILKLMSHTSHEMTRGELKQLNNRHNPNVDQQQYMEVIRCKTAILFAAAAKIGGILSNSPEPLRDALYDYGMHLGNAFQIIDDALDFCSNAETIGKNIGDDLADGKPTLPLIIAMRNSQGQQKQFIEQAIQQGSIENLDQILLAIENTNALDTTYQVAHQEKDKAIACLQHLDDSPYKQALIDLAEFSVERSN